jgi:hypothetical protein
MILKTAWTTTCKISEDLIVVKELVYERCSFICPEPYPRGQK